MNINTKKVKGRRRIRYASFSDLLADAERVASGNVKPLGNWSPGQIFKHLALSMDGSIDGLDFNLPAPVRFIMSLLFKNKFLNKELPPGFKSTDKFVAEETSVEDGLEALRQSIARQEREESRVMHPAFGNIGVDGWTRFHLRHAEVHMSFLVDGNNSQAETSARSDNLETTTA